MNDARGDRVTTGVFITFEGTEGCGKTTQIGRLAERLRGLGRVVREVREPGGTALGEEIRHTLKHSPAGRAMTPEAELLLMNAARAQLVREVIRPALASGEVVLCDRYYHSTLAYQGWGRQMDLEWVRRIIDFAVGSTRPDLTLLFEVPPETSVARQRGRLDPSRPAPPDRFEEAGDAFFARVAEGYRVLASEEPGRVRVIDAVGTVEAVEERVWAVVGPRVSGGWREGGGGWLPGQLTF